MRLVAEEDNSASVSAIYKGYSKKLAYLKKHRRISLASLRELFLGENETYLPNDRYCINRLRHLAGDDNPSDMMTKPHPHPRHWQLVGMLDMAFYKGADIGQTGRGGACMATIARL